MDKRLIYTGNTSKDRDVFMLHEDRRYLEKRASAYHPAVQEYIKNAKPIDNLVQVLLTALGAHPFWPANANGDIFPEASLAHEGDDYGYRTFVSNANYFTHHVNKDPLLAKGRVLHSVWNHPVKRVELIVGIDPEKDPEAMMMLDRGEQLCFSMGARLPYDVCTVCGNQAKTRAAYCDHLRLMMGMIDPSSGRQVAAINPYPKFFDISRVLIPADKTAYMWELISRPGNALAKVGSARLADTPSAQWLDKIAEAAQEKRGSIAKKSEIRKQILAVSAPAAAKLSKTLPIIKAALQAKEPELPLTAMMSGGERASDILASMLALGMTPTAAEAKTLGSVFIAKPAEMPVVRLTIIRRLAPMIPSRSYAPMVLLQRLAELGQIKSAAQMPQRREEPPSDFAKGFKKGLLAALAAVLAPDSLKKLLADHPIPLLLAGVPLLQAGRVMMSDRPLVSGQADIAAGSRPLYNEDWRRRLEDLQTRPVTVIKTAVDTSSPSTIWSKPALTGVSAAIAFGDQMTATELAAAAPSLFDGSILASADLAKAAADAATRASELNPESAVTALPPRIAAAGVEYLILEQILGNQPMEAK